MKQLKRSMAIVLAVLMAMGVFAMGGSASSSQIIAIAAGDHHSLALRSDGTVWAWGVGITGQLGNGTSGDQNTNPYWTDWTLVNHSNYAIQVQGLSNITAISAGSGHSLALRNDGTVWAWGSNFNGQLGIGVAGGYRSIPVQVQGLGNIIAISAGTGHSLALRNDGTVWAWGGNRYGQLGDSTRVNRHSPVKVYDFVVINEPITEWPIGVPFPPTPEGPLTNITAIAAGGNHSLALRSNGTVVAWGDNSHWQLGTIIFSALNESTAIPVQVRNVGGAAGTLLSGVTAIEANYRGSVALRNNGTVAFWGTNNVLESWGALPAQVQGLSNITAIAAGRSHVAALRSNGTVWAWGNNSRGQLGDGTSGAVNDRTTPVQVQGMSSVTAISAGCEHTIALRNDGTIWAWGNRAGGRLGDGRGVFETPVVTPVQVRFPSVNPAPVNSTALVSRINELSSVTQGNFTNASWAAFQNALAAAQAVAANANATQQQIDNALAALNSAFAGLVQNPPSVNTIFTTRWEATFINWLLFFLGFGWIWMWF